MNTLTTLPHDGPDNTGPLSSHVWPGGYPIVYQDGDGDDVCPKCANNLIDVDQPYVDDGCEPVTIDAYYIHYEGEDVVCAACDIKIPSSYGSIPDEDGDDGSDPNTDYGILKEGR